MATIKEIKRKTKGIGYQINFTHPKTKKQVRKIVWCSKSEAVKILKQIEADIAFGKFNMDSNNDINVNYSFKDLVTKYLVYSKANKSSKTVVREGCVINAFKEYCGENFKLSDITIRTIESFRDNRLSKGVKPASVALEMRHLKVIFNMGIKWNYCSKNPVVCVKMPKSDIIRVRYLLIEEIKDLLKVIDESSNLEFKKLVQAYLNTGARRIELLPPLFTWDNVDFKDRKILLKGKRDISRYIPMNDTLKKVLNENKSIGKKFPFEFKPSYVSHKIRDYYKLAGIEGANLHSLRKTFGSLLLQNGAADLFTISKLLGHSTVSTTEKYYVDLLDNNFYQSVAKLTKIM